MTERLTPPAGEQPSPVSSDTRFAGVALVFGHGVIDHRSMHHSVILAGGSGTRLWPASCRATPKQFLALGARPGESLLAATARRLGGSHVVVVTAAEQAAQVRGALPALDAADVIAEPAARNTAAALGLAAVHLLARDPDAVLGAIPADQTVANEAAFATVVERAFDIATRRDVIVTIGVVPTRPETGYGYLHIGAPDRDGAIAVERFVEKPDAVTAARYLASGEYLWNGGMFFVKARVLLAELERHMPETHRGLCAIAAAIRAGDGDEVTARLYPTLPPISIDYGVMEKATGVVTLRGDFAWNDVGSWSSLADYREADAAGNITSGSVVAHDAYDNIVVGDEGHVIALVGVRDLVVVQSGNRVLVVPRARAQDVRDAVAALKERGLDQFL